MSDVSSGPIPASQAISRSDGLNLTASSSPAGVAADTERASWRTKSTSFRRPFFSCLSLSSTYSVRVPMVFERAMPQRPACAASPSSSASLPKKMPSSASMLYITGAVAAAWYQSYNMVLRRRWDCVRRETDAQQQKFGSLDLERSNLAPEIQRDRKMLAAVVSCAVAGLVLSPAALAPQRTAVVAGARFCPSDISADASAPSLAIAPECWASSDERLRTALRYFPHLHGRCRAGGSAQLGAQHCTCDAAG